MAASDRSRADSEMIAVEAVTPQTRHVFVDWARVHGGEHDDSYTQGPDLQRFPTPGEIAALAVYEGRLAGAASLMVDGYVESGLARFRILHATRSEAYEALFRWIVARMPPEVHHVFCFLPEQAPAAEAVAGLGFAPTRYAVILEREPAPVPEACVPPDIEIRVAIASDAIAWASVANAAFGGDPGRYEMTEERAASLLCDERVLASFIAWKGTEPVGLSNVWQDAESPSPSAEIATLAVVPQAQGQGLGRALLRRALASATEAGLYWATLSTGSVNRPALGLYTSEGFRVSETRVCWGCDVNPEDAECPPP
jgi:mycothiol synthase